MIVKCLNCMGVGYFGQGSDCRVCGGTGQVEFSSLSKEEQEYLTNKNRRS